MTRRAQDNTKALDAFIGKKAEIDAMLARLQALSDDALPDSGRTTPRRAICFPV